MLRSRFNLLAYRLLRRMIPERFMQVRLREMYPKELLARMYLTGEGIEIGALHAPVPVPPGVRVRYVDYVPLEELQKIYPSLKINPPDIIDNGETLATFSDSSVDFIIASGFLEHTQDPIGTLKTFFRVVKPGGIVLIAIPDKRFTFDVHRPVTSWEHLLRDHTEGPEWSRRAAFEEFIRVVVGITDPEQVAYCVDRDMREIGHTHFHVWTQNEMLDMLVRLKALIDFEVEAYVSNPMIGDGTMVLRRGELGKDGVSVSARNSLELIHKNFAERFPELAG